MSFALPPLQWLRAYEASARLSSFSAAAAELNLTPAAISHQVRALEQRLGFQLFERLARGLQLTDIGRAYLPSVRKAFDELAVTTVGLFGRDHDTHITVRTPVLFATNWLAPLLPKFYAAFPHIKLRILTAIWADTSTNVDVDIRFGDGQWSEFEVHPLLREPSILVVREDTKLPKGSDREKVLALLDHGVVHIMGCEDRWTKLLRKHDISDRKVRVSTMTDNSLFAIRLTLAGLGPCVVQRSYAEPFLKEGLAAPLTEGIEIDEAHYILTARSAERTTPEAIIFREWLIAECRARRDEAYERTV
jgi:LysR family transcriptional regulator, glycine cleavage system transcriptional activator